jgi:hypothetical protein
MPPASAGLEPPGQKAKYKLLVRKQEVTDFALLTRQIHGFFQVRILLNLQEGLHLIGSRSAFAK